MNTKDFRSHEDLKTNPIAEDVSDAFQELVELAPVAMCYYAGDDFKIKAFNDLMAEQWRNENPQPANAAAVHDGFLLNAVNDAFHSGILQKFPAHKIEKFADGEKITSYYDHTFKPVKDQSGTIIGVLQVSTDVTAHVLAQILSERQHQQLLSYFHESPVALAIIDTEDLIFRLANPFYGELIGRDSETIINRSFLEVIPELVGQGFDLMFREVMASGKAFNASEAPVTLIRNEVLETIYVSLTCSPRFDDNNTIVGVSVVATDMTEQVLQRKKAEEISESLQGAIELANLGTYTTDLSTGISQYSERLRNWLGFTADEIITQEKAYLPVVEKDKPRINDVVCTAIKPGGNGIYDIVYSVINVINQEEKILHVQGRALFNDKNEAISISGTISDITAESTIRNGLEKKVRQRTEELASSNKQLEEANQQMSLALDQLESSNENLLRSNSELSQYAYIASHDLQEPLRKIRMYSGLLEEEDLSESNRKSIMKISSASERMSLLITDLLEYSKLIKSEKMLRPVDLNVTISDVVNDFELVISEKKAEIVIGKLPVFYAIALQMNQLFYNLIGNALKFTAAGKIPRIEIGAEKLHEDDIKKHISKPLPGMEYYDIFIRDNGIGFDVRYADQIFEVFKRLHPKDVFPGSGIGLALCRSIVTNHEGYLFVESEVGKGSTFHIILPNLTNK